MTTHVISFVYLYCVLFYRCYHTAE